MSWAEVKPLLAKGEITLVDARDTVAYAAGHIPGALHGVPIAVKDFIYTQGIQTGMGSPIFADFIPTHSAACVQSLVGAGAYVQGKTVTGEIATRNPGATTTPRNQRFTPGGS